MVVLSEVVLSRVASASEVLVGCNVPVRDTSTGTMCQPASDIIHASKYQCFIRLRTRG